jgi:hypothetical protein
MEYQIERSRTWRLVSLVLTVALVGGGLLYALS